MNTQNLKHPLLRFRLVAIWEGISFLVLLFIAMPLRSFFDLPEAVKIAGWAHGFLFILYILAHISAWQKAGWKFPYAAWAFLASLVPFATFVLEKQLKKQVEEER